LPLVGRLTDLWGAIATIREVLYWIGGTNEKGAAVASNHFAEMLLATPKYGDARKLSHHELQVFSQGGEDGIISEIFRRIGTSDRRFVEFGVQDGMETNTTYLLSQGWSGVWFEANPTDVASAEEHFRASVAEGRLRIKQAFVTAENATALMEEAGVPEVFDLLSLDIDRNTYHLWDALTAYRPRVVVVEYNSSIPPGDEWTVEYDADKVWNGTMHFGAGLKSYELLGRSRGYALVGCNLAGTNAFFVREELLADHFAPPYTADHHHEPPRYWLNWRTGHKRGWGD
jgi:hypothetical protein